MRILLFYKGDYGRSLRGPEMRYVKLAEQLAELGHGVVLAGRNEEGRCVADGIEFVPVARLMNLALAFFKSDVIVLHGGGPICLILATLSGFFGRHIVLDGYVPHWVELDEIITKKPDRRSFKLLVKAYFNVWRSLYGVLVFNSVISANKRQEDIFRGMIAPFSLTHEFSKISEIPFGCEPRSDNDKSAGRKLLSEISGTPIESDDFLVGWLGGTYGWFDIAGVMSEVSKAILENRRIKICFFGVVDSQRRSLLDSIPPDAHSNFVFMPWVEFDRRFEFWAAFDISLVWGGNGHENDYASRTRNFDCLSLGLPVVQNHDEEWGSRLTSNNAGVVTDRSELAGVLVSLANDGARVKAMAESMANLAPLFYWKRFAESLLDRIRNTAMSFTRRLVGFVGFLAILPALLVFFGYSLVSGYLSK